MCINKKESNNTILSYNKKRIQRGFDFLSPMYNKISQAFFGKSLINSQKYFIPNLKKAKSVLILGGGTGEILADLMKFQISEYYYYLDISQGMIDRSEKLISEKFIENINQVRFDCGSYQNISVHPPFDLVITPYFLDCFKEKEVENVINLLHSKLADGGEWLFVDFNVSNKSFISKISSYLIIKFLYLFFNVLCRINVYQLPNFSKYFSEQKLEVISEKYFLQEMLVGRIYKKTAN